MCANCINTVDTIAMNALGIAALASHARDRLRLHTPADRERNREEIRRSNVAFLSSMGLDPVAVLGPNTRDGRTIEASLSP